MQAANTTRSKPNLRPDAHQRLITERAYSWNALPPNRRYAIVDAGALRDAAAKIDRAAGTVSGTAHSESTSGDQQQSA